jgi:hypothetical protein
MMRVLRTADALLGVALWLLEFISLLLALVYGFGGEPWQCVASVTVAVCVALVMERRDRRGR